LTVINRVAVLILAALLAPPAASGQSHATATCDYARCGLSIAPRWNGLAVVSGAQSEHVVNLNFFWARDIAPAFSAPGIGSDSAVVHARRAVRVRRVAAALTNSGVALIGVAGVRAIIAGSVRTGDTPLLVAGGAAMVVSLPLHFRADGALSRAIWWYNRRFAEISRH
jgi:hypothetical protein